MGCYKHKLKLVFQQGVAVTTRALPHLCSNNSERKPKVVK